eukprot:6131402-Prymnesium_polylepis.1
MSRHEGGHISAGVFIHARWHDAQGAVCSGERSCAGRARKAIVCGRVGQARVLVRAVSYS